MKKNMHQNIHRTLIEEMVLFRTRNGSILRFIYGKSYFSLLKWWQNFWMDYPKL